MSRVSSHLTRRGGVFQYRRRVPAELADHPAFSGRPDFRKSLKTTNANNAREQALKLDRWIDDMVAEARGHQTTPLAPATAGLAVSNDYLRALQARWFEISMEVDQQSREGALADERLADRQAQRDDADAFLWSQMRNGPDPMAAQTKYRAGEALEEVKERLQFEAKKFNLVDGEPDYKRLKNALVEAEYEALRGRIKRQGGAISVEPSVEAIRSAIGRPVVKEASWIRLTNLKRCSRVILSTMRPSQRAPKAVVGGPATPFTESSDAPYRDAPIEPTNREPQHVHTAADLHHRRAVLRGGRTVARFPQRRIWHPVRERCLGPGATHLLDELLRRAERSDYRASWLRRGYRP